MDIEHKKIMRFQLYRLPYSFFFEHPIVKQKC